MFLDIGVGIFVSMFTAYFFEVDLSWMLIAFSILFALLPDADFLYFYPRRHDTKFDHFHRDLIHYPLLYLPIGTFLLWIFFGPVWATAFFLGSLAHFIHDSIAIGWGVKWLFPFSRNNYIFFYHHSVKLKEGIRKPILSLNHEEMVKIVKEHGDKDWVKNIYYAWHPIAVVEFGVFAGAILALIIYLLLSA